MEPIYLFDVAAKQAKWLAVRQTAVTQNIANANTPKYGAIDIEPFESVISKTKLSLASTQPNHMMPGPVDANRVDQKPVDSWSVVHSGNSVSLEQEMLKAGEVQRGYSLNTNLVKSFHRMLMTAVRG